MWPLNSWEHFELEPITPQSRHPTAAEALASLPATGQLAAIVPVLRSRLDISGELSDGAVLRSLAAIAGPTSRTDRWRAAFNSEVGRWLAARGTDLNTALNIILGLVPAPRG